MEREVERSIRYAERNIRSCILPNAGESIDAEPPLTLVLLYRTLLGRASPRERLNKGLELG